MNLAPTASTTAMLALGDALALALSHRKGFREEHFASLHPGGHLGKRLLRVETLMTTGDGLPRVFPDTPLREVIHEMSAKRLGMTVVTDTANKLVGIVTDGDLRRQYLSHGNLLERRAADVMTTRPVTITRSVLAVEALNLMEQRKITAVVVVDANLIVEGVVHLHDLWRTEMV